MRPAVARGASFFTGCWQRPRPILILDLAIELPGNERPACLEQARADDGAVRTGVADRSLSPEALL
jgi:hypothetical protein